MEVSPPQHWLTEIPRGTKMSILGPPKTFTEKAARLLLGDTDHVDIEYQGSMFDIHDAVNNDGHLGLLAYTNYSSGHEPDNLDALFTEPWTIRAEAMLRVQMVLGGPGPKNYQAVTDVYSKDVGLRQCSSFIRSTMPRARKHASNSTVDAIREVEESGNHSAVAIGPKAAHEKYGNQIWDEGISNAELSGEQNVTHFIVVMRSQVQRILTPGARHHGLILTPKDKDGVSSIATGAMSRAGMGLYSQPERPIGPMKYRFLYLMNDRATPDGGVDRMLEDLHRSLEPANGKYPLVQPISSWNTRVYDEGLKPEGS
jgi:prephenate dehydratase